MTAAEVVADPIGQLNLMLWMTLPLPGEYRLRPLLNEAGYRLFAIAPPMPLAPGLRERVQTKGLPCREQPEPDLLLVAEEDREFLMLECKRTMFGPDSSSADQARGLLLQTGGQFNVAVGLPIAASTITHLVYIAEHCDSPNPAEGLLAISHQLERAGFRVAPAGVVCLQARGEDIWLLDGYEPGEIPQRLHERINGEAKVQEAVEGEEAMPILLVPWDPNVDQASPVAQHGRRVLCDRLLTSLVVRIGRLPAGQEVEVEFDELLNEANSNLYERWAARNRETRSSLRRFCSKILHEALGDGTGVKVDSLQGGAGLRITVPGELEREAAIDGITKCTRKACPEIPSPDPQGVLFEDEEL